MLESYYIANNSQINTRSIGLSPNSSLQCITNRNPCCLTQDPRLGEWYLPNGELVQGANSTTAFYRSRGDNGDVSLNRPSEVVSPTGKFCCQVPNAADINQTLCVIIGRIITVCFCIIHWTKLRFPTCSAYQNMTFHHISNTYRAEDRAEFYVNI